MVDRSDLEAKRTPTQMQHLLSCFAEDREACSDENVHLRRGVVKDILEEYSPLCILAANLPGVLSARLASPSINGPDGIVEIESGQEIEELTVQITVANQSHQEALARERLSQGQPVFGSTEKVRDPTNRSEIQERGRVLETREGRLRVQVGEVVNAVRRKLANFYAGTDVLLVSSRIYLDDSGITYSWRADLRQQVEALGSIPYRRIFLANGDDEFLSFTILRKTSSSVLAYSLPNNRLQWTALRTAVEPEH